MVDPRSPKNPPPVVRPLDVYDCGGCGQRLRFDARGHVPTPQLEACRGLCDWTLVERAGAPVTASDNSAERFCNG